MIDPVSEEVYFVLCVGGTLFLIFWSVKNGIIRKDITFGKFGGVRKTGRAAVIWGYIFASLGVFLLVFILLTLMS